jgi:hypothetical protein
MVHSDWIPAREQDLVDLCEKWTQFLSNSGKQTEFGWAASECTTLTSHGKPEEQPETRRVILPFPA